jgi:hypothetical protein
MRLLAALFATATLALAADAIRIEAENLEIPGGWASGRGGGPAAGAVLETGPSKDVAPAGGAVRIPSAGKWRLWVRAKDFPDYLPGTRFFSIRLGDRTSPVRFGRHGRAGMEGWEWEDGGLFDLAAGPLLIVAGETSTPYARFDCLVLARDPYRPTGPPASLRVPDATPEKLTVAAAGQGRTLGPPRIEGVEERPAATLEGAATRFTFHRTAAGTCTLRVFARTGASWTRIDTAAESYRVLYRPPDSDPKIAPSNVNPTWDTTFAPEVRVSAGGASLLTRDGSATAPWNSGVSATLLPDSVRQRDARTVELTFPPIDAGRLSATWTLPAGAAAAELSLRFLPAKPGHISLGYHGALAADAADLDFLLLPFMYHGRRLPAKPGTLLSALTPTPISLVTRRSVSYALVADPDSLVPDWPSAHNSRYAFGIRNEISQAQPFVYSPVFGQPGSKSDGRAPVTARIGVWVQPGRWYDAWRRIVLERFALRDYRRPVYASLSDAALNLYDLIKNGAGWDAHAKGPWNIEARNTVSHSSPLLYLSLYLLTGDQDFYRRYTLPSLEYILSRPGPHFAAVGPWGQNYYRGTPLGGPASPYGATVWTSAFAMTGGRTPAFAEYSFDSGFAPRPTRSGSHAQPFEDALALYRAYGDEKWKRVAIEGGDRYIAEHIARLPDRDLGREPFLNVSFVPDWEGLLHLYEATGERRFLDASAEGARWLLTTLWVHPKVAPGDRTIHPGGVYTHEQRVWYLGDKRFCFGQYDEPRFSSDTPIRLPPTRLPEKSVPAWQVSNVGLGLEQPFTYARRNNEANITMDIWAPNLLRLAALTGDDLFRTAARNATIGRFGNYPGYYIDGYTDHYQKPDYPVKGPDVTWFYYHHVPPFAAYVLDYLFTDAEVRSKGAVAFPSTRQNGYVWFDSRLYGHAPGKVYGQTAWPWLHRTALRVDNVAVDRVLAHGDGRFHAVLLNQTAEPQTVKLTFDAAVLGRALETAEAKLWIGDAPAPPLRIAAGTATLRVPPMGIAALTLEGVRIDVPTHRAAPPPRLAVRADPGIERKPVPGAKLEAVGAVISVPPFAWRDLYVYVTGAHQDCTSATLYYRTGTGPEQSTRVDRFPCEFSVRLDPGDAPVAWRVAR